MRKNAKEEKIKRDNFIWRGTFSVTKVSGEKDKNVVHFARHEIFAVSFKKLARSSFHHQICCRNPFGTFLRLSIHVLCWTATPMVRCKSVKL